MRTGLAVLIALSVVACGGSDAPLAPAAPPTATLQVEGSPQWVDCSAFLGGCRFQGSLRNVGLGCAGTVRGVTRFFNNAGAEVASAQWGLGSRTVRPNELVLYTTIERISDSGIATYLSEPAWSNIAC